MSDRIFYVGAVKGEKEFAGLVPARFLTINVDRKTCSEDLNGVSPMDRRSTPSSAAPHYLGFVNGLTGIPLEYSERGEA